MDGTDEGCVEFLQWALPRLRMRWAGFRKVRRQVCKRLNRRMEALGLEGFGDYRRYIDEHAGEWAQLDAMCRITISRFYRDRGMFDRLGEWLLEAAPPPGGRFRAWSVGCASGEEPYTVSLIWDFRIRPRHPDTRMSILAMDSDPQLLGRAQRACYRPGSVRELPPEWVKIAFSGSEAGLCLGERWKAPVELRRHDLREPAPPECFDLILCRNLAFTYFAPPLQREIRKRFADHLRPGGVLMLGAHESLPAPQDEFEPLAPTLPIYRRRGPA